MISLLVSGQFCKKMGNSTCCQNLINCEKINTPPFGAQKGGHQNLSLNFDFRGHILTFRAENTAKSGLFKVKNNANTTSEQPQTNFKKVQKTTFLAPKMVKSRVPILEKVSIFECILYLKPQKTIFLTLKRSK